ncbi:MAG: hypothetical protein JW934_08080 [Anaerolineae bacterium]|nr:hypothetical protein [Anaerolineae bacterium]
MDCLILPCSQRKRDPRTLRNHTYDDVTGAPIAPAWAVYNGPLVQIARKYAPYRELDVMFLSARFGLIDWTYMIPLYDQKMTIGQITDEWVGTRVTVPWMRYESYCKTVYTCLPRLYKVALAAGLAPFGVKPAAIQMSYGQGYMSKYLKQFCLEWRQCHR